MTSPRALLNAWRLLPKKSLGQNFLADPSTAKMIVDRANISPSETVLEIGAGLGALTIPLARQAKQVTSVETDGRLMDLLKTELAADDIANVDLLQADILKTDIAAIAQKTERRLVVTGNLPYHISSQIIVRLISERASVERAAVMLQQEMARRLMASPGGKDYGRLTVMLRYCADIRSLAVVKANLFHPRPRVDSEVVEIIFHHPPVHVTTDEAFLFKIIKAAFGQRRKTLKNALSGNELRLSPAQAQNSLETAGIAPHRRAETLAVGEFIELSKAIATNFPPRSPSGPPSC